MNLRSAPANKVMQYAQCIKSHVRGPWLKKGLHNKFVFFSHVFFFKTQIIFNVFFTFFAAYDSMTIKQKARRKRHFGAFGSSAKKHCFCQSESNLKTDIATMKCFCLFFKCFLTFFLVFIYFFLYFLFVIKKKHVVYFFIP